MIEYLFLLCFSYIYRAFRLGLTTTRSNKSGVKTNRGCSELASITSHGRLFKCIASRMPKSYVEVGCSNNNVKGKSISFCILRTE